MGNTGCLPTQPALLEESARPAERARSPLQGGGVVGLVLGRTDGPVYAVLTTHSGTCSAYGPASLSGLLGAGPGRVAQNGEINVIF